MTIKLRFIVLFVMLFFCSAESIASRLIIKTTTQDSVTYDDSSLNRRTFEDLKDIYSGNEFIYERTVEQSGWWTRFKFWLGELFKVFLTYKMQVKPLSLLILC